MPGRRVRSNKAKALGEGQTPAERHAVELVPSYGSPSLIF